MVPKDTKSTAQEIKGAHSDFIDVKATPAPDDFNNLSYLNHEAEVKTYRDIVTRQPRSYRVTRVISPYLFFTEFDIERRSGNYRNWYDAMQAFYNNTKASEKFKIRTTVIFKFRCYVYLDDETNKWERVRVFKINMQQGLAEVYFCDMPQYRIINIQCLMEIHPEFCVWTAQGFPSHLIHIRPVGGGFIWSKVAVDYFKKLVEGKVFKTLVMSRTEERMPEAFPDNINYVGLAMINRDQGTRYTLQAEMVTAGYAEATGIFGGYKEMFDIPNCVPHFSLNVFQNADATNFSCNVDDEPEESQLSEDEIAEVIRVARQKIETIKIQALEKKRMDKLLDCPILESMYTLNLNSEDGLEHLPTFFQKRMAYIKFTHVISPSCGYIQMQSRIPELREMEAAISAIVDSHPHLPYTETRAGIALACLLQEDRNREAMWVRAILKYPVPNVKLIKVVLIDYGNEISVKHVYARYLPNYFKNIHSFANRIHMDKEGLLPSGGKHWSTDACDTFRKYICSWEVEMPLYYAWKPAQSQCISLIDFNQGIHFDPKRSRWIAVASKISPFNNVINEIKDSTLLSKIYTSNGVDVVFEILIRKGPIYQFESLTDMLVDNGYALRQGKKYQDDVDRMEIVNNAASSLETIRKQKEINAVPITKHKNSASAVAGQVPDSEEEDD